jgi:uncharacterized membrane protein YidH (DUF202 family)
VTALLLDISSVTTMTDPNPPANPPNNNELAMQRTELAEKRTGLAEQRTDLAEKRTGLSIQRTELASERNDLAEIRTALARERTRAAEERTLMAWIRTALSMISFGFGHRSLVSIFGSDRNQQRHQRANGRADSGPQFDVVGVIYPGGGDH